MNEVQLELLGNELPWFPLGDATSPSSADFRILLSHSPDQIPWAKEQSIPLMLAGHTHGGQISPPFIGPIVSPSVFGTRYACGLVILRATNGDARQPRLVWGASNSAQLFA